MFSENYIVVDKHSLTNKEYISTLDRMPWMYTSLYDKQYLPILDDEVYNKLQSFFTYRFPRPTDQPLLDFYKVLVIEHKDNNILSFDCRNNIEYDVLNENEILRHFKSSIQCDDFIDCKLKIDRITGIVDVKDTKITGIQYDCNANLKSVSVYDSTYNLQEYSDNEILVKLNDLCIKTNEVEDTLRGITTLYKDSNNIAYKFILNYPRRLRPNKILRSVEYVKEYRETYLNLFLENGLIDDTQVEYMRDILVGESKFDIEFVINENEEIEDIFFYHYKIYEFKDLTTA